MSLITKKERRYIPRYDHPAEVTHGKVEIDDRACTGCNLCVTICPADALYLVDKKARMKKSPDDECMFCGDCMAICPADAVRMVSANKSTGYFKTIGQGAPKTPRLDPNW